MKKAFLRLALASLVFCMGANASAQGLFGGHKGARVAGRAGAYVAKADDLYAIEYNPAGLAKLRGWTVQISNRLSYNEVIFDRAPYTDANGNVTTFDRASNTRPLQALDPLLAVSYDFGLKDFTFALAAYAPPGTARVAFNETQGDPALGEMVRPSGPAYMMVGREAELLKYSLSAAYQFKELFGVGVSAQLMHVPKLDYSLLVQPITSSGGTGNPVSSGLDVRSEVSSSAFPMYQVILGGWAKPVKWLEVGLSGQVIPTTIRAQGTIELTRLAGEQDVELTRNGVPANDVQLVIPLPVTLRGGLRYIHEKSDGEPLFDVELDVSYQNWSRVQNFALDSNGLVGQLTGYQVPINTVYIEKQWKDSFAISLGGDVNVLPKKLAVRGGFGYDSAVAEPAYTAPDFATGAHVNVGLGASVYFGERPGLQPALFELAVAYGYRHQMPVTVSPAEGRITQINPVACSDPANSMTCVTPGGPSPVVNAGKYQAFAHALSIDGIFRF